MKVGRRQFLIEESPANAGLFFCLCKILPLEKKWHVRKYMHATKIMSYTVESEQGDSCYFGS